MNRKQLLGLMAFAALPLSMKAQSTFYITVDPSQTYQTMEGFGASDCWTADYVGRYFSDTQKAQAAKWLFSRQLDSNGNPEGIGLSLWRVNLGAGTAEQGSASGIDDESRRTYCYLNSDGTYDWTKNQGQQYFMQQAKNYGVENMLLFSNSAPVYYTKNGKGYADSGTSGSNLKDDCYDKFADFLATCTGHFTDAGYPITYIDPVNEPQFDWTSGQEGSPWENANIAHITKSLDASLTSKGLSAKIFIPEACSWDKLIGGSGRASNQLNAFFDPANTDTYIGNLSHLSATVAGHSYWTFTTDDGLTTMRQQVADAAQKYGVHVAQSEWSMLDAAPSASTGFPDSYDDASYMDISLFMGKLIYCDLTYGNMNSWSYWTAFAQEKWGQKNRFYLLRLNKSDDTSSESYVDLENCNVVSDNSNLWVLGNYSFFIRPGYKRIALNGDGLDYDGLMGSAWISPDSKRIVTVFVNMNETAKGVKFDMSNLGSTVSSVKKYVTSVDFNLSRDLTLSETYSSDSRIVVPSRSVVTFTFDMNGTVNGIKDINASAAQNVPFNVYTPDGAEVAHQVNSLSGLQPGIYIANHKKVIIK